MVFSGITGFLEPFDRFKELVKSMLIDNFFLGRSQYGSEKICVLGSGTIGYQIAQLCLQHGFTVVLRDVEQSLVEAGAKAIKSGLKRSSLTKGK